MTVSKPRLTKRAAIYLRISRDPREDGLAVNRQREDCERLARDRGWNVVETYADTLSASKRTVRRPSYERMRADFAAGRFDALVCYDLDRLTRQPRELEDWIDAAEEHGLAVVTANGEADLSTDAGRLFARIKASVARAEVERKSARQRRANEQSAARGLPHRSHRVFGWEPDGVTVRESEAHYLREASRRLLAGDSLRSILRWFGVEGVQSPKGRPWLHSNLRALLIRERMAGILVRGGVRQPVSQIAPILGVAEWEELHALLSDPARHTSRGRPAVSSWLSGTVFCSCGSALGVKHVHMKGEKVRTYVCRASQEIRSPHVAHASIAAHLAEDAAVGIIYTAMHMQDPGTVEGDTVKALREQVGLLDEQIGRAEEAHSITGSASSLSLLARLAREREDARASLERAIADRGAQGVADVIRAALSGAEEWDGSGFAGDFDHFRAAFDPLGIDQKHALARATIRGDLRAGGGKGAKRIVWHTADGVHIIGGDE